MVEYEQQLAICHSELGNFESALAILHKAECQKDTIEYARGLYEEARVMRKMGNFPKALSSLKNLSVFTENMEIWKASPFACHSCWIF